jgi:hypothetical protein
MTPIPDRYDMAHCAERYFNTGLPAVEVGVFRGEFAAHNLKHWSGFYIMVDAWAHRPGDGQDKNDQDAGHWEEVRRDADKNTRFAAERRTMIQGLSVEVAGQFRGGVFDWIYIDAGHDYDNCLADLRAWWPKLRPGGLFSGDDYGLHRNDPALEPLTFERFAKVHGIAAGMAGIYKWGTAKALHDFCSEYGQELRLTWLNDRYNPAWYIIKI